MKINNVSDAASSVVTVFGFKLSNRPADREHPFGHARYEYIAAFIIAFAVVLIGVLLLKQSIEKIINPESVNISAYTYVVRRFVPAICPYIPPFDRACIGGLFRTIPTLCEYTNTQLYCS